VSGLGLGQVLVEGLQGKDAVSVDEALVWALVRRRRGPLMRLFRVTHALFPAVSWPPIHIVDKKV
jgi:hypothetical protein